MTRKIGTSPPYVSEVEQGSWVLNLLTDPSVLVNANLGQYRVENVYGNADSCNSPFGPTPRI